MKIIYLANVRIPTEKAHGLQIMKMVQAFKKANREVELVVAERYNPNLDKINPFDYYGLDSEFSIKRLWLLDLVDFKKYLRNFSVLLQNTSFGVSALIYLYLFNKKSDLIYSRDEFSLFFLCWFKKNLVFELHTFPKSKKFLYKIIFQRVKKIVVITDKLKQLVLELGIAADKIIVCPDGVDLNDFQLSGDKKSLRQKLNLPQEKNIILYTGHLFNWKGVYVLAKASKYLSENELIVFVGGMEHDSKKLADFIAQEGLKNILLVNHQAPTAIPQYLAAADVLVLPNSAKKAISVSYTSPMKMFEYMAAQRPIVASDLPSIREILNENNAILVKPDDSQSLAEGIKLALQNGVLSGKISAQALLDVQKFSWQNRAKNILESIK
ncbi:MAG: glycosyltransferase family 4 protein [Patescibacteria group bacterium]